MQPTGLEFQSENLTERDHPTDLDGDVARYRKNDPKGAGYECERWNRLTEDRDQWRALVEKVTNF